MKKIIALSLVLGVAFAIPANAKTYHIYKIHRLAKVTSVSKYGYVYHRLATVKCPFAGCRTQFSHK